MLASKKQSGALDLGQAIEVAGLQDLAQALQDHRALSLVDELADPRERLARFLEFGFERLEWGRVFAALCAVCSDARVEPVMRQVAEDRMNYLEKALRDVGFNKAAARDRAILIYAMYVGFWRLVTAFSD